MTLLGGAHQPTSACWQGGHLTTDQAKEIYKSLQYTWNVIVVVIDLRLAVSTILLLRYSSHMCANDAVVSIVWCRFLFRKYRSIKERARGRNLFCSSPGKKNMWMFGVFVYPQRPAATKSQACLRH